MPSNIYRATRLVTVDIAGLSIPYGFATKLTAAQSTKFGHTAYAGTQIAVFGSNAPKPPRAKDVEDSIVSFVDRSVDLETAGLVRVRKGKGSPNARTNAKSVLMTVEFYGVNYVWSQPTTVATEIGGDLTALGVSIYNGTNGIMGANRVRGGAAGEDGVAKPSRAVKTKVNGTDGVDTISTFVKTPFTGNPPAGWSIVTSKN
jgi:hypothetical protein